MNFLKQIALLAVAAGLGFVLAGCQPSDPSAPKVADISSIAVVPASVSLAAGAMQSLVVQATYSDGTTYDVSFNSTFASSKTAVATVSATGVVTAVAPGTATITATHTPSGLKATTTVTVAPLSVMSVAVTPATAALTVGAAQQLTVMATYNNASQGDVTAGSTFVSDKPAVATVSAAGVVTAVAVGTATITATHTASGKTATAAVSVNLSSNFATLTFEPYTLTGFGGAEDSSVAADPADGANQVAKVVKSATAEVWAGTTVSTLDGLTVDKIPFTATDTRMTARVYSPAAGIPVRLKVEDAANGTHSVETEATTTKANAWETLTFDFANQASGTAALNLAYTYNKASIFFDFGVTGAAGGAGTYYFDDLAFVSTAARNGFATITFQPYALTGFGGAEDSTVAADPAGGSNHVAKVVKSATAELWAGTTVSTGANLSVGKIPFTASSTKMSVRVYSPAIGIPVRLKVEDVADGTHSVETEATTTKANAWETLTFDFASQVPNTAPLNLAYTYNKASIFFDFGVTGAAGGAGTYYFDDLAFGAGPAPVNPIVFASGYASNNRTVEGGEWGLYSGNFTSYAHTYAGGGFVDQGVAAADSYVYLVITTSAPTTDGYMGIYTAAPGYTTAAPNAGVTLSGQANLKIELGMGAEWFAQAANKQLTVRLVGRDDYSNGSGGVCQILVDTKLTPTTSNLITYTIPLSSMTLAQPCNGGGFTSGVTTLAEALAKPIKEVHVQAVFPQVNTSVLAGAEYPTGFTRGSVTFE